MKKTVVFQRYFRFFTLFFFFVVLALPAGSGGQRVAVKVPLANIRSGPGTQYATVWNVEMYFPVNILEKSGKWYRFEDFEGDQGWIHGSLVDRIPSVITKAETCYIRSGPGPGYKILFTTGSGIPFKVLGKKGKWFHIQHADGDSGWIYETVVW